MNVEKRIWTIWYQGFDQAPNLVQKCWDSWKHYNPDYDFMCLDRNNLFEFIDLDKRIDLNRDDITVQKISALSRVLLLKKYGGIWTDSTVFCNQPLDTWIYSAMTEGFFAFRNPGRDRLASNWFIAAHKDNPVLLKLTETILDYFSENIFSYQNTSVGDKLVEELTRKYNHAETTKFWFSDYAIRKLKVYPYFIFHYAFNKVIQENDDCRFIWSKCLFKDAFGPHLLQYCNSLPFERKLELAKSVIDGNVTEMFKLNWRETEDMPYWENVLPHLFNKHLNIL